MKPTKKLFLCRVRAFAAVGLAAAIFVFAGRCTSMYGQQVAPADHGAQPATESIRSVLPEVRVAIDKAVVGKWKLTGEMKSDTEMNIESVRRDIIETLPGLLDQARDAAAPSAASAEAPKSMGPIGPGWAVYRNVDALYDVLLRVQQTAILSAPRAEFESLTAALDRLGNSRKELGNALMQFTTAQDAEVRTLRSAQMVKVAAPPPPPPPQKLVVEDGPVAKPKKVKKKPVVPPGAAAKPASAPAAGTPATPANPQ